jgi:hypothetical protein
MMCVSFIDLALETLASSGVHFCGRNAPPSQIDVRNIHASAH